MMTDKGQRILIDQLYNKNRYHFPVVKSFNTSSPLVTNKNDYGNKETLAQKNYLAVHTPASASKDVAAEWTPPLVVADFSNTT